MEEVFEYDEEYFYFHKKKEKKKKKSSFKNLDWYDANRDRFLEEEEEEDNLAP